MKLLILKGFNNYFNRKIKKYDTIEDYASNSTAYLTVPTFNFNPNDSVRTEVVLGKGEVGEDAFFDFEKTNAADYLVAYTTQTLHNPDEEDVDVNTIESRWFITEVVRTRGGQYHISLKRDSIADNFESLLSCPAFIKKGMISDDNPLILNDEGVRVNQIKTDSAFLKDGSGSSWIVGYMPKDTGLSGHNISCTVSGETSYDYYTIEDLATELGISTSDLGAVLTTDTENTSTFINGNIEIIGYINHPNPVRTVDTIIAGSQNYLSSITYGQYREYEDPAVGNCFADRKNMYNLMSQRNAMLSIWRSNVNAHISTIKNNWNTLTGATFLPKSVYNRLVQLDGKYLRKNGNYYKIYAGDSSSSHLEHHISSAATPFSTICSDAISQWNAWILTQGSEFSGSDWQMSARVPGKVQIYYNTIEAVFYLKPVSAEDGFPSITFSMSTNRNACEDQPFDMFAIPADDISIREGANVYGGISDYARRLAVKIAGAAEGLDNDNPDLYALYDIQLLPYCPIPSVVDTNGIDISNLVSGTDYDWINYTGEIEKYNTSTPIAPTVNEYAPQQYEATATYQSTITDTDLTEWGWTAYNEETEPHAQEAFDEWVAGAVAQKTVIGGKSKFQVFNQVQDPQSFEHADITVVFWFKWKENGTEHKAIVLYPKTASFQAPINKSLTLNDEMKIEAICNNYRLVAPNYQGSFDFNLAKNRGYCEGFTAYCTYKPYTPYIRVVPKFDWMYGINFPKEARGLICNGDYSLGRVNSQWAQYQLNNKNYQNIFNRDIQNLDVNQEIQRINQYTSGGINIVNSAAQGGVTGAIAGAGNPYVAAAGAAIAGMASTGGYIADSLLMEKALQEQRQYSIDKYRMSIGNIQAIQYTLTKVGSFDIDSAIFPILEYYTCTDVEKQALRMKIQYEGMTIGIVDTLGGYMLGGYLQADLIRNDTIVDDAHLLDDIYVELTKGVYM